MNILSNCKINLGLNIIKKYDNGYHELDMIMAPIDFGDIMEVECLENEGILDFKIKGLNLKTDSSNTITKVYDLFFNQKEKKEIRVLLDKKIPMQAGLGGGSSNAAFFLNTLNKKYNYYDKMELALMAKKIGADVPFFLENKTAHVRGIGEKIEIIPNNINTHILLMKPNDIGIDTGSAFSLYEKNKKDLKYATIDKIKKALEENDVSSLEENIENSLEQLIIKTNKKLYEFKYNIEEKINKKIFMSGSGSTFFCFYETEEKTIETYLKLKEQTSNMFLKKTKFL